MTQIQERAPSPVPEQHVTVPAPDYNVMPVNGDLRDLIAAQPPIENPVSGIVDHHTGAHISSSVLRGNSSQTFAERPTIPMTVVTVESPNPQEQKDPAYAWNEEPKVQYDKVGESLRRGATAIGRYVASRVVAVGRKISFSAGEKPQVVLSPSELAKREPDVPKTPVGVYEKNEGIARSRRQHLGGPNR